MNRRQRRNDQKLVRMAAADLESEFADNGPFRMTWGQDQLEAWFNTYCHSSSSRWRIKKPWSWRVTGMGLASIMFMPEVNSDRYATKAEAEAAALEWNRHATARARALISQRARS